MAKQLKFSKTRSKKIIAVGAHPDDLEFAAGGTLALLSSSNEVIIVLTTSGDADSKDPHQSGHDLAAIRELEATAAARILGVSRTIFLRFPDLGLRRYRQRLSRKFLQILLREKPDIGITWDFWGRYLPYLHPDHRTVAEVVMETILEATLPSRLDYHQLSGGVPLDHPPQLWLMAPAGPNFIADVTSVQVKKIKAILAHRSQASSAAQVRQKITTWFPVAARGTPGVQYKEAFRILNL